MVVVMWCSVIIVQLRWRCKIISEVLLESIFLQLQYNIILFYLLIYVLIFCIALFNLMF